MANALDILRYVWKFIVFFVTNCCGLFTYVMWMTTLLPLRFLSPALYWQIESFVFKGLQSFVVVWLGTGGYGVIESGHDIAQLSEEEALLLCNHQSTADTPSLMVALWGKGRCMNTSMWVMEWLFRFTNFGIVSTIRKDVFVKQGKDTRDLQMAMLKKHLKSEYLQLQRKWIILFPEGGFLYKRLESSQSYARKNGYPVLQNVTLPRLGALQIIIDTIGAPNVEPASDGETMANGNYSADPERPLKWLIDMTIGYRNGEGGPPDMLGMCVGYREKQDVHVHYRAHPLSTVPRDDEGLLKWVYARYEEKDRLLEYFNTHGRFPAESDGGLLPTLSSQRVHFDWVKVALFQAFYILSSYFHYTCIVQPLVSMFY